MKCRICNSSQISKVIDLGKQPLQTNIQKIKKKLKMKKNTVLKLYFVKNVNAVK